MAVGVPRDELIKKINQLFGPKGIAATARSVKRNKALGPDADVFDILHALGAFPWVKGKSVDRYRKSLPIPMVNQKILTAAFRAAMFADKAPTPLHFEIYSGRVEAVEVTTTAKRIDVVLLRVDPPGYRRPRPRKRR